MAQLAEANEPQHDEWLSAQIFLKIRASNGIWKRNNTQLNGFYFIQS